MRCITVSDQPAVTAYIGLGSNLGERQVNLCMALTILGQVSGITISAVSSIYETKPVGTLPQADYLNMVATLQVALPAPTLLSHMLAIEAEMGRVRTIRWGPRTIDLDLLVYDDLTIDTTYLQLPHPRLTSRAFVLAPLVEIAPHLMVADESVADHLAALVREQGDVRRWGAAPVNEGGEFVFHK